MRLEACTRDCRRLANEPLTLGAYARNWSFAHFSLSWPVSRVTVCIYEIHMPSRRRRFAQSIHIAFPPEPFFSNVLNPPQPQCYTRIVLHVEAAWPYLSLATMRRASLGGFPPGVCPITITSYLPEIKIQNNRPFGGCHCFWIPLKPLRSSAISNIRRTRRVSGSFSGLWAILPRPPDTAPGMAI